MPGNKLTKKGERDWLPAAGGGRKSNNSASSWNAYAVNSGTGLLITICNVVKLDKQNASRWRDSVPVWWVTAWLQIDPPRERERSTHFELLQPQSRIGSDNTSDWSDYCMRSAQVSQTNYSYATTPWLPAYSEQLRQFRDDFGNVWQQTRFGKRGYTH